MAQQEMGMREYRKGNWTVQETMILIEAKRMDDERRKLSKKQPYSTTIITSPTSNTTSTSTSSGISKPITELRWKWVEEYCWRKGCLRSQNQCNDKWDNLMRDYKKIRDYQRSLRSEYEQESSGISNKSYWDMDKIERKDRSLPTNMLPQIYQALFEVVEQHTGIITTTTTTTTTATATTGAGVSVASTQFLQLPPISPPTLMSVPPPALRVERTQMPVYVHQVQQPPSHYLSTLELEASEHYSEPESSTKRRRKDERVAIGVEGTSTGAPPPPTPTTTTREVATTTPPITTLQEVGSAICRSASVITEVIQANEEKEERRHREIMHLHETRLRFDESRLEVTRQGFNGLTDAINKLANSILSWANTTSHTSHHQGP